MANPWDTLPVYWQAQVNAVAAINASFAEGDLNEDGQIDADDLSLWQAGVGKQSVRTWKIDGDANDDNVVDGADLLTWQRQVGANAAAAVVGAAVPEPSAVLSALVCTAETVCIQRRSAGEARFSGPAKDAQK
jgi:hypothetical protein